MCGVLLIGDRGILCEFLTGQCRAVSAVRTALLIDAAVIYGAAVRARKSEPPDFSGNIPAAAACGRKSGTCPAVCAAGGGAGCH